ncbi:MAG: type II toxin-antitoxin system HicA family toxin [Nocardioidaceae bacterium]
MRRRDVVKALTANGCRPLRNVGGHEVWGCPCGKHRAPLPNHREITAGVVKSISGQMACLRRGWLQ